MITTVLGPDGTRHRFQRRFNESHGALPARSFIGGLGVLAFEYWTYGQSVVRVRSCALEGPVLLYFIVAAPGYFGFLYDELMPVFLTRDLLYHHRNGHLAGGCIAASHPDSCPSDDPKAGRSTG